MKSGKILARTARWQKADLDHVLAGNCQPIASDPAVGPRKDAIERLPQR